MTIIGIIAVVIVLAAAYLLRPLMSAVVLVLMFAHAATAASAPPRISIGLLLVAVDAQRDHLRVSEALRLSNPGPAAVLDLAVALPAGSQYVTFHRGLVRPVESPTGFRDRLMAPHGLLEIAYSYALPAEARTQVGRAFPLPVQRMEIVVRGGGVRLWADHGQALPPLTVGGETLPRWDAGRLRAEETITFVLDHLPVSRPWLPPAAAGALAAVLATGLGLRLTRRLH